MPIPPISESWLERVQRKHDRQDGLFAEDHGLTVGEYRAFVHDTLRELLDDPEVRVRCRQDACIHFLQEQLWRTIFNDGEFGEYDPRAMRVRVEASVLGVPQDCPDEERPAYGYLRGSDEDGKLGTYGSVILHLDSSVRASATVTCGDSAGATCLGDSPMFAAAPLMQPELVCRHAETDVYAAATLVEAVHPFDRYAEVQLHDGFGPAHVTYVSFSGGDSPSEELIGLLQRFELEFRPHDQSDP